MREKLDELAERSRKIRIVSQITTIQFNLTFNKKDKQIIINWITNTSTSENHKVFEKLGYKHTQQLMMTIFKFSPINNTKKICKECGSKGNCHNSECSKVVYHQAI